MAWTRSYTPQPQMVDGHVVEDGGKRWTLTLRPGLLFHDGTPVLARDAAASIRRWASRDAFGASLMAATDELSTPDDRTLLFRLKKPFPGPAAVLGPWQQHDAAGDAGAAGQYAGHAAGDRDGGQRPLSLPGG